MFIVTNKEQGAAQVCKRPNQVIDLLAGNAGSQAWTLELAEDGTPKIGKPARLGAGKTLFAAGIGEGLGVEEPLTSQSFILARSHRGLLPVVHADVYRLGTSAEFEDLDLPEQARDGVLLIEWGDVVAHGVPEDHLLVHIDTVGDTARRFSFTPSGSWCSRPLGELSR